MQKVSFPQFFAGSVLQFSLSPNPVRPWSSLRGKDEVRIKNLRNILFLTSSLLLLPFFREVKKIDSEPDDP
jgi:hypothetical protein